MAPSPPNSPSAPSPDSPSSPAAPPPKAAAPPPQAAAPPSSDSSPPPEKSPPAPPPADSPPPKSTPASPPPSKTPSNSPPPPSPNISSPPPPDNVASPPPPPHSSNKQVPPPPPEKQSRQSPPPPPSSTASDDSNKNLPLIIGGAVLVGLVIIALIIFCARRNKKKKRSNVPMQYYRDQSQSLGPNNGGAQYYNSSQHPNWHNGPPGTDHVVKLPPPPGGMGAPGGGWAAPPPPPPMMSSGDDSSTYNSGPHRPPLPPPSPNLALGFNKSTFTYDELAAATGGFAQANLLGQGGFGYVHKGMLPNGKEIAVKSLKSGSGQGEREFQAEVEIISRVHHRHLVSLVGYCIAGGQRMLVYEFVPNNNLEFHLHGKGRPVMDFSTRLKIALGSAKGLAYLHEDCHPRIIHRDIKAANILIDYNFEAMVADFGLAKLSSDTLTHVSTRVMGTFGYLAPEYASSGKLTEKSDVFSYGVMLLELITGKRPVDNTNAMEDSLVDWARPLLSQSLEEGNYDELADPLLERNYNPQEMARMVACAAASIRHSAKKRPKMSQIVRALEGDSSLEDLNEGVRPGQSSAYGSAGSSDYGQSSYNADMKKFRQIALSSQEFPSSASSGDSQEMTPKHNF